MARMDRLREEIGWLKLILGISVALDGSLIAWMFSNFENSDKVTILFGGVGIVVLSLMIAAINWLAYQRMVELEDL